MPQEPKPIQLDPPGPYETPTALELQRVKVATEESPARLCLMLEGGCSLHIPVLPGVVERLRLALEDYPEVPNIPQIGS